MKSLINTLGSKTPQQNDSIQQVRPPKRKDSILDSVDTGFGEYNILLKDCPNTKFKQPLFKENYLSDFVSETEKQLVRNNLGVIGEAEVTKLVKDLVTKDISSFITIEKIEELLQDLDFVDSKVNSYADYTIPDKLFKL